MVVRWFFRSAYLTAGRRRAGQTGTGSGKRRREHSPPSQSASVLPPACVAGWWQAPVCVWVSRCVRTRALGRRAPDAGPQVPSTNKRKPGHQKWLLGAPIHIHATSPRPPTTPHPPHPTTPIPIPTHTHKACSAHLTPQTPAGPALLTRSVAHRLGGFLNVLLSGVRPGRMGQRAAARDGGGVSWG